jgi:hypothetical protein
MMEVKVCVHVDDVAVDTTPEVFDPSVILARLDALEGAVGSAPVQIDGFNPGDPNWRNLDNPLTEVGSYVTRTSLAVDPFPITWPADAVAIYSGKDTLVTIDNVHVAAGGVNPIVKQVMTLLHKNGSVTYDPGIMPMQFIRTCNLHDLWGPYGGSFGMTPADWEAFDPAQKENSWSAWARLDNA